MADSLCPEKMRSLAPLDDIFTEGNLVVHVDQKVVLAIKAEDVLHSFFVPNLRLKQDVVPGMKQFVWFEATQIGEYEIVCAELCGWGHYKMKGNVIVKSKADYEAWLKEAYAKQEAFTLSPEELPSKEEDEE